ncbi:hypothetical protein JQ575_35830 [Bradyrhizobium sp. JYMT SZCCT0428]|nr:hypothetical protein [Bradyrhizobium sp. JYMT SZCCT0428]
MDAGVDAGFYFDFKARGTATDRSQLLAFVISAQFAAAAYQLRGNAGLRRAHMMQINEPPASNQTSAPSILLPRTQHMP